MIRFEWCSRSALMIDMKHIGINFSLVSNPLSPDGVKKKKKNDNCASLAFKKKIPFSS